MTPTATFDAGTAQNEQKIMSKKTCCNSQKSDIVAAHPFDALTKDE